MTLQIRDIAPNLEAETTDGPVHFHDCIDYRGLTPDQRQRVKQHVIRHAQAARAQAPHDLGDAGLRTLQAAAGGGAAIIRALAKAVLAAAGKWWRAYNIRRAHIAAVRELHALDDRTLRDIGVSRSEIEWVVVHGRDAPRFDWVVGPIAMSAVCVTADNGGRAQPSIFILAHRCRHPTVFVQTSRVPQPTTKQRMRPAYECCRRNVRALLGDRAGAPQARTSA